MACLEAAIAWLITFKCPFLELEYVKGMKISHFKEINKFWTDYLTDEEHLLPA